MLLSGGGGRLRIFVLTAAILLSIIFLWTTNGPDTATLKKTVTSSLPAAVTSHFSPDKPDADSNNTPSDSAPSDSPNNSPIDTPSNGPSNGPAGSKEEQPPPSYDITPLSGNKGIDKEVAAAADAPYFVLVGDSTTRGQLQNGGGWGDAFLWQLAHGAEGANQGVNGALSTGYFHSPMWNDALTTIRSYSPARKVYVTIQFGHNDQMPNSNVTLEQYQAALEGMAREVLEAGGTPILVTPLARRDFDADDKTVTDNLKDYREHTLAAFDQLKSEGLAVRSINLNAASLAYVGAVGKTAASRYNKWHPFGADTTHLNELGATVFGRIVADLMLGHPPTLVPSGQRDPWSPGEGNDDDGLSAWIRPDPYMSGLVWHGDAI